MTRIIEINQKPNLNEIKTKKSSRAWFFTNERLNNFLKNSFAQEHKPKNIMAIGGSGDFIFNMASLLNIEEINICDIRIMAILTTDFKIAVLREFGREEIIKIYSKLKINNKNEVYSKINQHLHPASKYVLEYIFSHYQDNNFLKCLKKSKLWHENSFLPIKYLNDYILYLTSPEKFKQMLSHLNKINIYHGSLLKILTSSKKKYYDLIYVSNVLDGKAYCENRELYLNSIKQSLNPGAFLLLTTSYGPSKTKKKLKKAGFKLYRQELHRFSLLDSLKGHYDYSFLLFKT